MFGFVPPLAKTTELNCVVNFQVPKSMNDSTDAVMFSYNVTTLRLDPSYIAFYVHWFLLFSTGIIPMGMLIFLNSRIYAKILETRRLRQRCRIQSTNALKTQSNEALASGNQAPKRHEPMSTKDFKMARVLLSIVLVFFICHLPR